jgi:hypothetical protein
MEGLSIEKGGKPVSVHHDRIIESTLRALKLGSPVRTSEGDEIGKLAEIANDRIKVDAPLRPNFWVGGDDVVPAGDGHVQLAFVRGDLEAHRVDPPGQEKSDPLVEQKSDRIVPEQEQVEMRIRMERELAEQRQSLAHMHRGGPEGPPDTFGTIGEPVGSELERRTGSRPPHGGTTSSSMGIGALAWLWLAGGAALASAGAWEWRRRRRRRPSAS